MNKEEYFPPANLSNQSLEKLKMFEEELRKQSGDNLILIAYEEKEEEVMNK